MLDAHISQRKLGVAKYAECLHQNCKWREYPSSQKKPARDKQEVLRTVDLTWGDSV